MGGTRLGLDVSWNTHSQLLMHHRIANTKGRHAAWLTKRHQSSLSSVRHVPLITQCEGSRVVGMEMLMT